MGNEEAIRSLAAACRDYLGINYNIKTLSLSLSLSLSLYIYIYIYIYNINVCIVPFHFQVAEIRY